MNAEQRAAFFYEAVERLTTGELSLEDVARGWPDDDDMAADLRLAMLLRQEWSTQEPSPAFQRRLRQRLDHLVLEDERRNSARQRQTSLWRESGLRLLALAASLTLVLALAAVYFNSPPASPSPTAVASPGPAAAPKGAEFGQLPAVVPPQLAQPGLGAPDGMGQPPQRDLPKEYELATPLPRVPETVNVYRLKAPDLGAEAFVELARRLDFTDEQIDNWLNQSRVQPARPDSLDYPPEYDVERPGWWLHYYPLGNAFTLQARPTQPLDEHADPSALHPKTVPESEAEAIRIASDFLTKYDLLPADCAGDVTATLVRNTYPTESGLVELPDHWAVKFQRRIDGLPVTGFWHIGVVVWVGSDGQVTRVERNRRELDSASPYPIKTAEEAWEDLKAGKVPLFSGDGFAMPAPTDGTEPTGQATINEVKLVYREWEVNLRQEYLQPLYAFSGVRTLPAIGEKGPETIAQPFVAYVPAVKDEHVARVQADGVDFKYQLQAALPPARTSLEVYNLEKELVTADLVKSMAAKLGFGEDVAIEPMTKGGETHYYIQGTPKGETSPYHLAASSGSGLGLSYGPEGKHFPAPDAKKLTQPERMEIARRFLESRGLLPEDLAMVADDKTTMPVAFGRRIDGEPVLDRQGRPIVDISVNVMDDGVVTGMEYRYRRVTEVTTRPAISPERAWQKLVDGQGLLFSRPNWMGYLKSDSAVVQSVRLAYLQSSPRSAVIEPVYVFEGTATLSDGKSLPFAAYVAAVE